MTFKVYVESVAGVQVAIMQGLAKTREEDDLAVDSG